MRVLAACLGYVAAAAQAADTAPSVFPDPGMTMPRLRFHDGGVARGRPTLFREAPDMATPVSGWMVLQWRKSSVLRPDANTRGGTADPLFGRPDFSFDANESRLKIYERDGSNIFELQSDGGRLEAAGGSNLFLGALAIDKAQTFDRVLTYSLRFKITKADISAPDKAALSNGAVLAQIFSGFSLRFDDPQGKASMSLFLQIGLADSRDRTIAYRGCYPHGTRREIVYTGTLAGDPHFAFRAEPNVPLYRLTYNLNRYLCAVVAQPFTCRGQDGSSSRLELPPSARDFRHWSVREMYAGLETEDTDLRVSSTTREPQGHVSAAIQISDLRVLRDSARPFDASMCSAVPR